MIKGFKIPNVVFKVREGDNSPSEEFCAIGGKWVDKTTDDYFKNKRVVIFSLPGAFTPTCSSQQLPGFEKNANELKKLGIDEIYCCSVNDAYTMNAWSEKMQIKNVKLIPVFEIPNNEIPTYLNAADVLILTSKYEGSVNVVKEAMACNTPIVSTDVGDVKKNISGLINCQLSESHSEQFAQNIDLVLSNPNRSNGRAQIFKRQYLIQLVTKISIFFIRLKFESFF